MRDPDAWFRQPVLWLGAAILATALPAASTIVLASPRRVPVTAATRG
jgi:hypothetical protein